MINQKICDVLKVLNIPVIYYDTNQSKDKYIIFSVYNEIEINHSDDTKNSIEYSISINYWFKDPKDIGLYTEIKKILKENGFIFKSSKDRKDGNYYGKNMDFIYVNYKGE